MQTIASVRREPAPNTALVSISSAKAGIDGAKPIFCIGQRVQLVLRPARPDTGPVEVIGHDPNGMIVLLDKRTPLSYNLLPGDTIEAEITSLKPKFYFARPLRTLSQASHGSAHDSSAGSAIVARSIPNHSDSLVLEPEEATRTGFHECLVEVIQLADELKLTRGSVSLAVRQPTDLLLGKALRAIASFEAEEDLLH